MPNTKKPFVDFRAIRARISIQQVLDHYGLLGTLTRSGERLSGPCPLHHGTSPTQFRVTCDKNLWNCFGDCKAGGNVLDFIALMEGVSIHDAALRACEWFNVPIDTVEGAPPDQVSSATPADPEMARKESIAPNPALKFRLEKLDRAHPYFTERGLTPETVVDFGLGYFTGDKGLMVGLIAIPIHNAKGEVVAYAGRWPGDPPQGTPKYKLPPGFKKGQELFNLDRAIKAPDEHPLVVVEGFFDAIKLHQNGCRKVVALMGSSLSLGQERLIRQHTQRNSLVLVALDEDEAGRGARDDLAARLARFCFVKVQQFELQGTQPEHLSPEQVQQLMEGVL